ncbi:MAG: ATP-binding protein [Bdellovibrionota bacterium]
MEGNPSQHLKNSSQEILEKWESEVRKLIPAARYESEDSLRDSIPEFLKDLILALETNLDEQQSDLLRFAHKHGRERAGYSEYSIEDAITEYNILRRIIFKVLENRCILPPRDRDIIYESISIGLAKAGAEYARIQMKEVEALKSRLQLITDIQPTLIAYMDLKMNFRFANETFREWFHVDPSTILSKNLTEMFQEEEFLILKKNLEQAFSGETVRFKEWLTYPSGRKYVEITYKPHIGENNQVLGIFTSVDDLTEEMTIIESLRREQIMRDKFISTLSHDLRTPLTASKMSAQIVARKTKETAIHTLTTRIVDNIDRADRLIQDLLDASRIRAGKMVIPETEEFDIVALIRHTLEDLTTIHGDRFKFQSPEMMDVNLSHEGIRRIVENLCSNAIKYGSPIDDITINLRKTEDKIQISVCNKGNPLIHIDKDKLFEPFEQVNPSSGKTGWGIGLTIVKGIAEAQGGTVRVETDGQTTFTVTLPTDARPYLANQLH